MDNGGNFASYQIHNFIVASNKFAQKLKFKRNFEAISSSWGSKRNYSQ